VVKIGHRRKNLLMASRQKGIKFMKLYECIVDDGERVFKALVASKSKKELLNEYRGNGNFEKIKDVTQEYFTEDSVERLEQDLRRAGWGEGERRIIEALLDQHIRSLKKI